MESINIYSGTEIISNVVVSEDLQSLKDYLSSYSQVFAVMDRSVAMLCPYAAEIAGILNERGIPGKLIDVSEEDKNMNSVLEICSWLLDNGADRGALVLAIGGGITTDMAGFAASIYKRGISFGYVPTTFLAQVDASIGGKTGVNFKKYKNMLGVIRQPAFTFLSVRFLESLSRRDFLSGSAELLKTFIIEDNGNYDRAIDLFSYMNDEYGNGTDWQEIVMSHRDELSYLTASAVKVKAGIVSRDQYESDERRKLNLGHTFAHAIETQARKFSMDITHGEAVAIGIIMSARLASELPGTEMSAPGISAERLEEDFERAGLQTGCPFEIGQLSESMKKDKKAAGGKVNFVLPESIGNVVIRELDIEDVCRLLGR